MDILDMAVLLRDSNKSLRTIFPDYEERSEPCRNVIRDIMQETGKDVLPALTVALQRVVDRNPDNQQRVQIHSLWFTAAATDLLMEQKATSVADRVKYLVAGLI